ncbi:alpha/beta hydrolase [Patescibacteria group bacterium]|nr:alpha/beta hydrolase [Patescibacteria group bacterium]
MDICQKQILILHGWAGNSGSWKQVREILENNGYNVIVPDLPGFGDAPLPTKSWSVSDYADFIFRFIQPHNLDKFYLLGHSFGGRIAIKFSVKYPEKLKTLILVSSAGIKPKKTLWQKALFIVAKIGRRFSFLPGHSFLQKIFYKFIVRKKDYLKTKGVMRETFKKVIGEDLIPYLSQISTPCLLIWGEKDKMTPLSDAYLMKKKIQNSKLEIVPGAGHSIHLESPEKLVEKILKFIRPDKPR